MKTLVGKTALRLVPDEITDAMEFLRSIYLAGDDAAAELLVMRRDTAIVANEREGAAKICEDLAVLMHEVIRRGQSKTGPYGPVYGCNSCASAIRARRP